MKLNHHHYKIGNEIKFFSNNSKKFNFGVIKKFTLILNSQKKISDFVVHVLPFKLVENEKFFFYGIANFCDYEERIDGEQICGFANICQYAGHRWISLFTISTSF